jgi:hypothetical protein
MKYGLMYEVYFNEEVKLSQAEKVMEYIKKTNPIIARIDFHNAKELEELKQINDDVPTEDRPSTN